MTLERPEAPSEEELKQMGFTAESWTLDVNVYGSDEHYIVVKGSYDAQIRQYEKEGREFYITQKGIYTYIWTKES